MGTPARKSFTRTFKVTALRSAASSLRPWQVGAKHKGFIGDQGGFLDKEWEGTLHSIMAVDGTQLEGTV